MDPDIARAFLGQHHRGVLATSRADGRPQLSPVTCALDSCGRVVISTRETAMKTKNLRRDPRASLSVFTDGFFGVCVEVAPTPETISPPAAMDPLVDYYRALAGYH